MTALSGADLPPYQLQCLLDIVGPEFALSDPPVQLVCAQALGQSSLRGLFSRDDLEFTPGPEIYVGCSNGDLLRFTLHPDANSRSMEAYTLLSRQSVPNNKPIENMILVPSLSRVLVHSDRQILVYTLPALDMIPLNVYKPIRNVISLAVDEWQLRHAAHRSPQQPSSVEFCVIKRQSVSIYHLREKPIYEKDIPLPARIQLARRSGRYLCVVDNEYYNIIDLETASLFPILPISQAPPSEPGSDAPQAPPVKPFVLVISDTEFLLLSWTGASTLGLFITGEGEPVRGTLEWSQHPISIAFDDPHVTALLPDGAVEIHNIETQALVQSIPAPTSMPTPAMPIPTDRKALLTCPAGFSVPSAERATKLRPVALKLGRLKPATGAQPTEDQVEARGGETGETEEAGDKDDDVEIMDAL